MKGQELTVIRILSDRELVVSRPANCKVTTKDEIEILGGSDRILDPIEKKILGEVVQVKARLSVSAVYDEFILCESQIMLGGDLFSAAAATASSFRARLNVNPNQIDPLPRENIQIQLGDKARILHKEEISDK